MEELQKKVTDLKRLHGYAKRFGAHNTYDLKIDLERAEKKLAEAKEAEGSE